jgi:hypothetical protein
MIGARDLGSVTGDRWVCRAPSSPTGPHHNDRRKGADVGLDRAALPELR